MAAVAFGSSGSVDACSLASWEKPIKCGTMTVIRTVEIEQFPSLLKILQLWKNFYEDIPKDVCEGCRIISLFEHKDGSFLGGGRVLVIEDSRGVAQAFARVTDWFKGLCVEELAVAPWNNTPCIKHTKSLDWILQHRFIKELTYLYREDPRRLVKYTPYTGTLMMYGVLEYAKFQEKENVHLFSLTSSQDFYATLGMKKEREKYIWNLADGLPEGLFTRMRAKFPEELASRVHPLKG